MGQTAWYTDQHIAIFKAVQAKIKGDPVKPHVEVTHKTSIIYHGSNTLALMTDDVHIHACSADKINSHVNY